MTVKECGKTITVEAEYYGCLTGIEIELTCTPDAIWCKTTDNPDCYDGYVRRELQKAMKPGETLALASLRLRRERPRV